MAFTKEIKGKTVIFAKSAKFFNVLNKIFTLSVERDMDGQKMAMQMPGADMAIEQFKGLFEADKEVERETLEYHLGMVGYALQFKMDRDEFFDWLANLDNSDLVEFAKKVKEELDTKKLISL
ncbi:hypothetical protein IW492_05910 [Enterococcus sp. BWB1-3]|uniref:hypothetical protein n=1 Tax=Enterococcus sp. BWB1-3 TaxID=2787713 RepID=UPI001922883D|nr:hypothetical protein [Enterococcus sp. BWB1-3]MBL1228767.1 hypothetical protein [Enterococcus sp. BWB1-3]